MNGCYRTHGAFSLVSAIHNVSNGEGKTVWQHVSREANLVVDALAKFGLSLNEQIRIFDLPPSFISFALKDNVASICFPRGY